MYQNNKIDGAIAAPNRKINARLMQNDNVLIDSVKSFTITAGSEEITIGSAISSYVQATVDKQDVLLSGKEVSLEIGLEVDGEMEYIPMGVYTIQNPKIVSNKISFTAYDCLTSKCNSAYYSKLTYPVDALDVLKEIEAMTGVTIDTTGLQKGITLNKRAVTDEDEDITTTYVNPFDGYTYKETIGFIAGLFGKFAVSGRTGNIEFRWYQDISYEIPSRIFYNDLQETEESFATAKLTCDNTEATLVSGSGVTGINMQNPVMTQDLLDAIYLKVKDIEYTPTTLRFIGDPRLEIGDIVTAVKNDDTQILIPIVSLQTSYDGGLMQTLASYGNTAEEEDADTQGPLTQMVERVSSELMLTKNLLTENLTATNAEIKNLSGDVLNFKTGEFENLKSDVADFKETTTEKLKATDADIENLKTDKISATDADLKFATIENLNTTNATIENLDSDYGNFKETTTDKFKANDAEIENLKADKISVKDADLKYANIDFSNIGQAAMEYFYAKSGLIKDVVVGNETITGELVGVTIRGDLIEGNTIVADKLVIKGNDGLYYKLNTNGVTTEAEQTDYNSLNGQIIRAKSVTAEKISVEDLVAFGATIGGMHITEDSLYSGVKDSVDNTTRGFYFGKDGQIAFGDSSNYLKYYKDSDGKYKLAISTESFEIKLGDQNLNETIEDIKSEINDVRDEITTILYIDSSQGIVFKNNAVSTVLSVILYHGNTQITDIDKLKEVFGSSAYLQWKWQRLDEDSYGIISANDSRIIRDGFGLVTSPDDVDVKVNFKCDLIV